MLYEIFTFGRIPYAELSNIEVFEKVVNGHRMAQPKGCPDEIFAIMWSCWRSGNRPSFAELDSVSYLGRKREGEALNLLNVRLKKLSLFPTSVPDGSGQHV